MASNVNGNSSEGLDSIKQRVAAEMKGVEEVGPPSRRVLLDDDILDAEDPAVKEDIIRMIIQYLHDNGYTASMMTIQDEANVKWKERQNQREQMKKLKRAIVEGEWGEVKNLFYKSSLRQNKSFLYAIYKQQYLEMIDKQESQKAYSFLLKRLKPLEVMQSHPSEFQSLAYLLTCKAVQDAPAFKHWEGIASSREQLLLQFQSYTDFQEPHTSELSAQLPPHRLTHLLRQAVSHQIENARYHPKVSPKITTLLEDYTSFILPNSQHNKFMGHNANVKCVDFVGKEGCKIVSGSSDNSIRLWDVESGNCDAILTGHASRVWDVTSTHLGHTIASASGDGTVKLWNLQAEAGQPQCIRTLGQHMGDVYSVRFHSEENHVVTAGYDKDVRIFDVRTGDLMKTFTGHKSSVSRAVFNPTGNMVISGSKDSTIRFWDIVSGTCIQIVSTHLGEVTSVEMNGNGNLLLSCSKDNSNRLWDLRTPNPQPIRKFKGHQNTSKNFVRAGFGPREELVVGGSEDGCVYIWDIKTGNILQTLRGHRGIVYNATWNTHQQLLASCAHDGVVTTWKYDESLPLFIESDV